jgi:RNA polymerase sigma-70 factor (ECF subfamily)
MQKKDETLVTRLQKGERKAMEELYDTYSPVLLGVAMRYSNRREDAEDLVHEALLRILKGVRDFRETFVGSFEVWMRRITVNQCLSALRKKNDFQHLVSTEKMEASLSNEDEETSELPDLSPEQLLAMMQSLPDGYRTVLNLYVFEQLSHKEIAKELNISENTSKSQLAKARMAMKRKLSQLQNKEEFA